MRLSLHPGVYTSAAGLLIAGAGGIAVAPAWSLAWGVGWFSIVTGIGTFLWGIKINGGHWWRRKAVAASAGGPEIGTLGAAVFGVGQHRAMTAIDIKNFGSATAFDIKYRGVCGLFPMKPLLPQAYDTIGSLDRCEPGHAQNIQFHFQQPLNRETVARLTRDGGFGLYAFAELTYRDAGGQSFTRLIGYYLDPLAVEINGRLMMGICQPSVTGGESL